MPEEPDGGGVSFAGMKFDHVPRWALGVAVLTLALVGSAVYVFEHVADPVAHLTSVEAADAVLRAQMAEYAKHFAESPETSATLLDDVRGKLTVSRYPDGCVLLARSAPGFARSALLLDLTRDRDRTPTTHASSGFVAVAEAAGRCLNPHPGDFKTWNERPDGCWVKVWRQWPDGCTHFQFFDACHGTWDTNPNGTPRVHWTVCVH